MIRAGRLKYDESVQILGRSWNTFQTSTSVPFPVLFKMSSDTIKLLCTRSWALPVARRFSFLGSTTVLGLSQVCYPALVHCSTRSPSVPCTNSVSFRLDLHYLYPRLCQSQEAPPIWNHLNYSGSNLRKSNQLPKPRWNEEAPLPPFLA